MSIERIRVRGVRGIKDDVTVTLKGRSLLVLGDNGTGKSSLDAALRWALTGANEPTEDPSFTTPESFRRHVQTPPSHPAVHIEFKDGSFVTVRPGSIETSGNGEQYRNACKAAPPFLRRDELLNVLTSKPGERFRYFESFLGLEPVDHAIKGLGDERSALEQRVSTLRGMTDAQLSALRALLPGGQDPEFRNVDAYRVWAFERAKELGIALSGSEWGELVREVRAAAQLATTGRLEEQRGLLTVLAQDIKNAAERWMSWSAESVNSLLADLNAAEAQGSLHEMVDLIEHALSHLRKKPGDRCPVCGQAIVHGQVIGKLEKEREQLKRVRELRLSVQRAFSALSDDLAVVAQLLARLKASDRDLDPLKLFEQAEPTVGRLIAKYSKDPTQLQAVVSTLGAVRLKEVMGSVLEQVLSHTLDRLQRLPRSDVAADVQMLATVVDRLQERGDQIQLLELERQALIETSRMLESVYEALRKARQDTAKEALKSIEGQVAEYYFSIHPREHESEATGAPSIRIQRHGKGTAFVKGQFSGKLVDDPRFVYSDGHLDTVGICIFLALRRLRAEQEGDPLLLVLDDIVLSIDLGHARRLIRLLCEEFGDHQMIMLTHNGLFAHWCTGLTSGLQRVQIRTWTLAGGPVIGDHLDARAKLKIVIETGGTKDIALRLMELMDEWLAEARFVYAVPVEAKYGEQYTLTDIWNPFAKRLKDVGKRLGSGLGGAVAKLDALRDLPQIRNLKAAHENEIAREFPRNVMVEIARSALDLVDALYCADCAAFVRPVPNANNPSVAHCPKHHIQYVHTQPPSEKPGDEPDRRDGA